MYEARVVHHIPGRMRIRIPSFKGVSVDLEQVNHLLQPLEGLKQIDFSPITGSVLLHYDAELHEQFPKQLSEYVERALGLTLVSTIPSNGIVESGNKKTVATQSLGDSRLAGEIYGFFNRINNDLKKSTGNVFDLKSVLPLGIGTYALLRAGSNVTTPLWVTLAIFSFTSFAILNPVPMAVVDDPKPRNSVQNNRSQKKKSS